MKNLKLEKIAKKFTAINYNEDNYSVGGGLDGAKFASNRHEDANNDEGKLTEGKATQLFKTATGLELEKVKRKVPAFKNFNFCWRMDQRSGSFSNCCKPCSKGCPSCGYGQLYCYLSIY